MCASISQVFRVERRSHIEFEFECSPCLALDEVGLCELTAVLCCSPEMLGWRTIELIQAGELSAVPVHGESCLGQGLTSEVYSFPAHVRQYSDAVAKRYRANYDGVLRHERSILAKLVNIPGTPKIVAKSREDVLIMRPLGDPVQRASAGSNYLTRRHIVELVDIIRASHGRGIVHRDVRLSNMLLSGKKSDRKMLLIDWGFAVDLGSPEPVDDFIMKGGTLTTASPRILEHYMDQRIPPPLKCDDLQALVRTMYLYRYSAADKQMKAICPGSNYHIDIARKVEQFWSVALQQSPWNQFEQMALKLRYKELATELSEFCKELCVDGSAI